MVRLHREFNVSVAEIDYQDLWQNAVIACTVVSNDNGFTQHYLNKVINWVENSWPDLEVIGEQIEIW